MFQASYNRHPVFTGVVASLKNITEFIVKSQALKKSILDSHACWNNIQSNAVLLHTDEAERTKSFFCFFFFFSRSVYGKHFRLHVSSSDTISMHSISVPFSIVFTISFLTPFHIRGIDLL